jgi:hypothetical protein
VFFRIPDDGQVPTPNIPEYFLVFLKGTKEAVAASGMTLEGLRVVGSYSSRMQSDSYTSMRSTNSQPSAQTRGIFTAPCRLQVACVLVKSAQLCCKITYNLIQTRFGERTGRESEGMFSDPVCVYLCVWGGGEGELTRTALL